jgi:vacuolar-type H+-ATPase subunit F/Vma7
MTQIAAIGEERSIRGFALAGVSVLPAADDEAVRAAWSSLDPDAGLVILTPAAIRALRDELAAAPRLLWVELPG